MFFFSMISYQSTQLKSTFSKLILNKCDFRFRPSERLLMSVLLTKLTQHDPLKSPSEVHGPKSIQERVQGGVQIGHPERYCVDALGHQGRVDRTDVENNVERHPTH